MCLAGIGGEATDEGCGLVGKGACREPCRDLGRHMYRRHCFEEVAAARLERLRKRKSCRCGEKFQRLVQFAQMAECLNLRGQKFGEVLPALSLEQLQGLLTGACALVGGASGKPLFIKAFMYRALVARKIWAGCARRLVDGECVTLVKGQCNAAERGTSAAIGRQVRGVVQPTASSKAVRKTVASSASGAEEPPRETVSPPNFPTARIATLALPASTMRASAWSKLQAIR